nr:p48 [Norovirus GIV]
MKMASNDASVASSSTTTATNNDKTPTNTGGVFSNLRVGIKKALNSKQGPLELRDGSNTRPPDIQHSEGQVRFNAKDETVQGIPDLTTAPIPTIRQAKCVPPMSEREVRVAQEPQTGSLLEMYDGSFYHYAIYIENGLVAGINRPSKALTTATVDVEPIGLWWRVVYTPPFSVSTSALYHLQGEKFPYNAFDNNCYNFCCQVLELDDCWMRRRYVQRTSGFFDPYQSWNPKPSQYTADSKLERVGDALLTALGALFSKPIKNIVGKLKPLNFLNLLSACDWTFAGIVETAILIAELFDIYWDPPDVTNFLMPLLDDFELQ